MRRLEQVDVLQVGEEVWVVGSSVGYTLLDGKMA